MGAVMGSKYLKAIAVHGSEKIPLADETQYKVLRTQANQALRDDPVTIVARQWAPPADYYYYLVMPKRYFQDGVSYEDLQVTGTAVAASWQDQAAMPVYAAAGDFRRRETRPGI
jgi:aldehyde:ferredoxin oxidoreductase